MSLTCIVKKPHAQIASPDGGKYAKELGSFVQPQRRSTDQSEAPQAVESCRRKRPSRSRAAASAPAASVSAS